MRRVPRDVHRCPVSSCNAPWGLTSPLKTTTFIVKMLPSSDKTAATAESTLILLAAAKLAVASSSPSVDLKIFSCFCHS